MVQGRVENGALIPIVLINPHPSEGRLPTVLRSDPSGIETICIGGLGIEVPQRTFDVHEAQSHARLNLFYIFENQCKYRYVSQLLLEYPVDLLGLEFRHLVQPFERPIEAHGEIHMLLVGPVVRNPLPHQRGIVDWIHAIIDEVIPVRQVHNELHCIPLLQRPTVEAHAFGCRQLHHHATALQFAAVITGMGLLAARNESVLVTIAPHACRVHGPHSRHQQDISIVTDSRALQVGMTKTIDLLVGDVEAATTVPPLKPRIGTQLHHTEWHRCSGVGVPMPSGTDERIHRLVQRHFLRSAPLHHYGHHAQGRNHGHRLNELHSLGFINWSGLRTPEGNMAPSPGFLQTRHLSLSWNPKC